MIRCVSKLERVSDDDDWFLLEKSIKMRPLRSGEVLDLKFSNYLPYVWKKLIRAIFGLQQPHKLEYFVVVHTTYIRNNIGQKCEGNCGFWVLNGTHNFFQTFRIHSFHHFIRNPHIFDLYYFCYWWCEYGCPQYVLFHWFYLGNLCQTSDCHKAVRFVIHPGPQLFEAGILFCHL